MAKNIGLLPDLDLAVLQDAARVHLTDLNHRYIVLRGEELRLAHKKRDRWGIGGLSAVDRDALSLISRELDELAERIAAQQKFCRQIDSELNYRRQCGSSAPITYRSRQ